jgi:hypothetical protein
MKSVSFSIAYAFEKSYIFSHVHGSSLKTKTHGVLSQKQNLTIVTTRYLIILFPLKKTLNIKI